jgi:hypothetical protein
VPGRQNLGNVSGPAIHRFPASHATGALLAVSPNARAVVQDVLENLRRFYGGEPLLTPLV